MRKIIFMAMIFLFTVINISFAGPRIFCTCMRDYPVGTIGLFGNAYASNPYAPLYQYWALREIFILGDGVRYSIPITTNYGFALSGNLQMTAAVVQGDTTMKQYLQNYTVNGKTFSLSIKIQSQYSDGHAFDISARMTWPNGAPSTIAGIATNGGVGHTMRIDPDFLQNSNKTGLDGAGWRPLTAYSDNTGLGWDVSAKALGAWNNSGLRVLARFFDSDWRAQTTPAWNIQWIDGWPSQYKTMVSYLKGFLYSDQPIFSTDYCSPSIQTIASGGYPENTQLSSFTIAGGGADQGAFLTTIDPTPSQTSNFFTEIYLLNMAAVGKRSINFYWQYYSATYGNNRYVAFGDSVPGALRKLLWGTGSKLSITREQSNFLKCNYYGNGDNLCTTEELYAMEFDRYNGRFIGDFSLNTAAYVLASDQGDIDNPDHCGGLTFINPVGYPGEPQTIAHFSRAFIFPRAAIHTGWGTPMVYFGIAHELGHTFGMNHQWSNCTHAQGWDCPNGTIMSYSSSPKMDYGPDAKTWFQKAPDNWVQPVCGSGPIDNARSVNGVNNYDLKVNNIINW